MRTISTRRCVNSKHELHHASSQNSNGTPSRLVLPLAETQSPRLVSFPRTPKKPKISECRVVAGNLVRRLAVDSCPLRRLTRRRFHSQISDTVTSAGVCTIKMDNPGLSSATTSSLWIFGYGSLCWRPGIEYNRVVNGFVRGYARRFWQGNTTHRGTTTKPGRVATLVEDEQSEVWGCAYEVSGETALPYLTNRECKLGGYMTKFTRFYPCEKDKDNNNQSPIVPFTALLYIATPKNDLWLGDAPLHEVANQIVDASGECGHNVEYLIRLADFMRYSIPEAVDDHLFTLEYLVRARIKERNMCIKSLMGSDRGLRTFDKNNNGSRHSSPDRDQPQGAAARADSFQYTARVPEKNLRCLNI